MKKLICKIFGHRWKEFFRGDGTLRHYEIGGKKCTRCGETITFKLKEMTPEEKAKELIDKFRQHAYPPVTDCDEMEFVESETRIAKASALICVGEIIVMCETTPAFRETEYWQQVKQIIESK